MMAMWRHEMDVEREAGFAPGMLNKWPRSIRASRDGPTMMITESRAMCGWMPRLARPSTG